MLSMISIVVFGQSSQNFIKPIGKDGFKVDSILSMRGDVILYLRAGTEFDILKEKVEYIEHSQLGRIDIAAEYRENDTKTLPIPEPDFNGEAFICDFTNNTYVKMEKAIGQVKTKDQFWGPEQKLYVKPAKSPIRIKQGQVKVVIRVPNINEDPNSFIKVSRFSTSFTRKLSLARQNELTGKVTYGGRNDQELPFEVKKYGESSFLLNFTIEKAGEYCITISNPNNIDGKLSVSCFGVDKDEYIEE